MRDDKRKSARHESAPSSALSLRITDQETARVVAVHRRDGPIVGAGCLIDERHVLTCRHVIEAAVEGPPIESKSCVYATLAGLTIPKTVDTRVLKLGGAGPENDLALLEILGAPSLAVGTAIFASPIRHGGKHYSVLGFPGGVPEGRSASGALNAADARGLVQMDRGGALSVLGGYSGAPVWSPSVNSFVGIVVTEHSNSGVSWCIPSKRICEFFPELKVRFRIPTPDRPIITDWSNDEPNVELFGTISDNGRRRLRAAIKRRADSGPYSVKLIYEFLDAKPSGGFVTFITHPSFTTKHVDAYELFAAIRPAGRKVSLYPHATEEIEAGELFTVAAVGDGGATALTLNLCEIESKWE